MADLFTSLVQRTNGQLPLIRPQIAPMFSPPTWTDEATIGAFSEADDPLPESRGRIRRPASVTAQTALPTRDEAIAVETLATPRRQDQDLLVARSTPAAPPRALAPPHARQTTDVTWPANDHQPAAIPDRALSRHEAHERREPPDSSATAAPPEPQEMQRPTGQSVAPPTAAKVPLLPIETTGSSSERLSSSLPVATMERSEPARPQTPSQPALDEDDRAVPISLTTNLPRGAPATTAPHPPPVERGGPWPSSPPNAPWRATGVPDANEDSSLAPPGQPTATPAPPWPDSTREVIVTQLVAEATTRPLGSTAKRHANGVEDAPAPVVQHAPAMSLMPSRPAESNAGDGEWGQPAARGQLAPSRQRLPPEETAAPVVRVTIGRVDVRLVAAPATAATRPRPARTSPHVTLAEYLRRREGAGP